MFGDLVDFGALIVTYFLVFFRKWQTRGKDVLIINTLMYIYLSFVLYFTLMPIITSLPFMFNHPYIPINMVPFVDVIHERGDYWRQLVLNVVMTVPFGFLLPLTNSKYASFLKVVIITFLLSLSIELVQPLLSGARSADITDIITNVAGSAVGYIIYMVFRPIIHKILARLKKSPQLSDDAT